MIFVYRRVILPIGSYILRYKVILPVGSYILHCKVILLSQLHLSRGKVLSEAVGDGDFKATSRNRKGRRPRRPVKREQYCRRIYICLSAGCKPHHLLPPSGVNSSVEAEEMLRSNKRGWKWVDGMKWKSSR